MVMEGKCWSVFSCWCSGWWENISHDSSFEKCPAGFHSPADVINACFDIFILEVTVLNIIQSFKSLEFAEFTTTGRHHRHHEEERCSFEEIQHALYIAYSFSVTEMSLKSLLAEVKIWKLCLRNSFCAIVRDSLSKRPEETSLLHWQLIRVEALPLLW